MINTKTKGELGNRIEYDVEHDLFHPQNVYSEEYITPTFVEYVRKLEKENAELKHENEDLQIELNETKLAIDTWKKNAGFWHKETKGNKFRKLAKDREKQIAELEKHRDLLAIAYQQESEGWKKSDNKLKEAEEIIKSLYFIIQDRIDYKNNILLNDEMYRAKQFIDGDKNEQK